MSDEYPKLNNQTRKEYLHSLLSLAQLPELEYPTSLEEHMLNN